MPPSFVDRLVPPTAETPEALASRYPARALPEGAMVMRVAPSPTGFMHIGTLYTGMITERLAHQSKGVFFVRIEDTDQKREVEGAVELILKSFEKYQVVVDEGPALSGDEKGNYGPYTQSRREGIYKTFVRSLLEQGKAYPCFCTTEELNEAHSIQEASKISTGYYGTWARCRNLSDEQVLQALDVGKTFGIRFRSEGNPEKRVAFVDMLKGERDLPENNQDVILLKSEGLPTYHFAHVVDDHLMGTTHVTRGDEWFSSVPVHLQLFEAMGWKAPQYGHLVPLQKIDGASRRKLSKRKDPEASISFYDEQGYPTAAVTEYLLNLANSDFEEWRKANPDKSDREFMLTLEKLGNTNGALLNFDKLNDISKTVVAHMPVDDVYGSALAWAKIHDVELAGVMEKEATYTKQILNIERQNGVSARKDIAKWSDVRHEVSYFFDEWFATEAPDFRGLIAASMEPAQAYAVVEKFLENYRAEDVKEDWLNKIRELCTALGYATNTKEFKKNPEAFKGSISQVTAVLRILLTGRTSSPDLYEVMQVLGMNRLRQRLSGAKSLI